MTHFIMIFTLSGSEPAISLSMHYITGTQECTFFVCIWFQYGLTQQWYLSKNLKRKRMETCPGQCLISPAAEEETFMYLQRIGAFSMHWEHDKWEFYIHNYVHQKPLTMLPDFITKIGSINTIFQTHRIFFSFLTLTLILRVINPCLLSQVG